jgi:hypothetical protein
MGRFYALCFLSLVLLANFITIGVSSITYSTSDFDFRQSCQIGEGLSLLIMSVAAILGCLADAEIDWHWKASWKKVEVIRDEKENKWIFRS